MIPLSAVDINEVASELTEENAAHRILYLLEECHKIKRMFPSVFELIVYKGQPYRITINKLSPHKV
jgi:hypothetical protein